MVKQFLIENGGYRFTNLGDTAMLQVGVMRIREHLPDAKIIVFTNSPENLKIYCPDVIAFPVNNRDHWINSRLFPIPMHLLPRRISSRIKDFENSFKFNYPKLSNDLIRIKTNTFLNQKNYGQAFFDQIKNSDAVIATGGGYITDEFGSHASQVLMTFKIAQDLDKPTAMFGQGLGPLTRKDLINFAKKVFPFLSFLGLREGLASLQLASQFQTPIEKIGVTGDDALEIAMKIEKSQSTVNCIGVNIRIGYYAGHVETYMHDIGNLIEKTAEVNKLLIIPVPVYIGDSFPDLTSAAEMCHLLPDEVEIAKQIKRPEELVRQILRCRIVITGSYHAAVFALANGIPVVALAASEYYANKFKGLANQFGKGCEIVILEGTNYLEDIQKAIDHALYFSNDVRANLIAKAEEQVQLSRSAWNVFLDQFS